MLFGDCTGCVFARRDPVGDPTWHVPWFAEGVGRHRGIGSGMRGSRGHSADRLWADWVGGGLGVHGSLGTGVPSGS